MPWAPCLVAPHAVSDAARWEASRRCHRMVVSEGKCACDVLLAARGGGGWGGAAAAHAGQAPQDRIC